MITVTLPWPDPALFPNRKGGQHWATFQAAKARARMDGFMSTKQAVGMSCPAFEGRTPISIVFHAPDRRRRDWDGMAGSIKHHLDGIARALGVDDSIFRPVTIDDTVDPNKRGFVTVEIGA
ncbi:hypothetical protein H0A73_17370 [Alcaligenaceae bacterium]|nr:hypothetical protein [Alcaligenaceae bacterium]